MKEKYIRPTVVSNQVLEGEGVVPLAAFGGAAALLAGYAAGRAVTSAMNVNPVSKIPSIKVYKN